MCIKCQSHSHSRRVSFLHPSNAILSCRTIELRSQPIRSKLLALHLLSSVVKSHPQLFFMPAKSLWPLVKEPSGIPESFRFIDSVKEFLILSLTRNATSIILPVFEISMELFGLIWKNLRSLLKVNDESNVI
jgi:brefeldin A-inhibited guanine nucleotide-exchange protein